MNEGWERDRRKCSELKKWKIAETDGKFVAIKLILMLSVQRLRVDEQMGENGWFFPCFLCATNEKGKKCLKHRFCRFLFQMKIIATLFWASFFPSVSHFNNNECPEMLEWNVYCFGFFVVAAVIVVIVSVKHLPLSFKHLLSFDLISTIKSM